MNEEKKKAELLEDILKAIDEPLSFTEAAKYIKLKPSYLYKLTSKGLIPHYKPSGKLIYFSKKDLDSWIYNNKKGGVECTKY